MYIHIYIYIYIHIYIFIYDITIILYTYIKRPVSLGVFFPPGLSPWRSMGSTAFWADQSSALLLSGSVLITMGGWADSSPRY
jgi:hypothetical protein